MLAIIKEESFIALGENKRPHLQMTGKCHKGLGSTCTRVVTEISSCRVNTTSRRGIKRLGISFGSIFFYFPIKVAGATLLVGGENPQPPALNDNPVYSSIMVFLKENKYTCYFSLH